jgi:hypothetical protein
LFILGGPPYDKKVVPVSLTFFVLTGRHCREKASRKPWYRRRISRAQQRNQGPWLTLVAERLVLKRLSGLTVVQ